MKLTISFMSPKVKVVAMENKAEEGFSLVVSSFSQVTLLLRYTSINRLQYHTEFLFKLKLSYM